jgi:N-succinyldiaminopimelate aminotransferase
LPDFNSVPKDIWQRCQMLYLCSPGNPTGAVIPIETLTWLISMADTYGFIIASDECYSEIYFDENAPPAGLLQAAAKAGLESYKNCLVFHSLSKRSNLPGMRSGFVGGDANLIAKFRQYRTYHGCAMPPPIQAASLAAWTDEEHVLANRDLYRRKFAKVMEILSPLINFQKPDGAFYLWAETAIADTEFARQLFAETNVTVLPGSYLSREVKRKNPGENWVRMALVASESECVEAAYRIGSFIKNLRSSSKL